MLSAPPPPALMSVPTLGPDNCPEWLTAVLETAIQCHPDRPDRTGLAGLVLPADEFARMDGAVSPFRPKEPPQDVTTTAHAQVYNAYATERRAVATLRTVLFASVPQGILASCPGYDHVGSLGTRAISIPELMLHVRGIYGAPSPVRHRLALRTLQTTQEGCSFHELLGIHLSAHAIATACGQPVPEGEKIRFLLDALGSADRATAMRCHVLYAEANEDYAAHRFGDFTGKLRGALRATRDTAAIFTESDLPSALAAKPVGVSVSTRSDPILTALKELTARVDRLTREPSGKRSAVQREVRTHTRSDPSASSPSDRYCWTHGAGRHTSTECRNTAQGHQLTATLRDRRGGSVRGF